MPWQERGFMLYTNEEPLVQRTCIKTANLQRDNYPVKKIRNTGITISFFTIES